MKAKPTKGFTLVELIVVIAILVVLSGMAVVAFVGLTAAAERNAAEADAAALASALNNFNAYARGDARIENAAGLSAALVGNAVVLEVPPVGVQTEPMVFTVRFDDVPRANRAVGNVLPDGAGATTFWSILSPINTAL